MINPNAVYALYPNVKSTTGNEEETFIAFDIDGNQVAIDFSLVNAWVDPEAYKYKRAQEYPPHADYLDAIVKDDSVQLQKYIDDCLAVKAKYPKPEEEE
tara:strand:+ start:566 stop:862 length:297 start_codon:yes stop_codon:yes gene_type:complete